ncbi:MULTISPECIES: MAPEG family protein [unclassified Shinella]|uniref:MAPEG family protein n=1 Tax=unclassified Shinella TaxID=2643062 RepID=UPI0003C53FC4|nr:MULTISPECIES: MAPEG family protein [unclassified Shinella]EYR82730.1 ribosomal protein L11 [Shinella sp. DD12]MCW5712064.1 MAPEG family protein [Shinella sp.]TAA51307.1 MAPEG family protein [Shinella sp. JR1-6]
MVIVPSSKAELRKEQHKILLRSGAAAMVCMLALGGAQYFLRGAKVFPDENLESRLLFIAAANLLLVVWVIIGVAMVARGRRHSAEDIGGSAYSRPSPRIAVAAAFLQNTLEQFVIASVTLSALVMLEGAAMMPFIAASVVLFGVGRVCFLVGYSKGAGGRAFGMALTALPSIAAFVIALAHLITRVWQT